MLRTGGAATAFVIAVMRACRLPKPEDPNKCRAREPESPQGAAPRDRLGQCACQPIEPPVVHVRSPPTSICNDARFRYDNFTQARIPRCAFSPNENLPQSTRESARARLAMI